MDDDLNKHRFTPEERSEFKAWIHARTGLEWSQQSEATLKRLYAEWKAESRRREK